MFTIKPDAEFKRTLKRLEHARERIELLEQAAAYRIAEYALKAIVQGIPDQPAYAKAFKNSLQVARIEMSGASGAAASIVGQLSVNFAGADRSTTLIVLPSTLVKDRAGAVLADARFQPWALDQLPPVTVTGPILLRLREPGAVDQRRQANRAVSATVLQQLQTAGVQLGSAFNPTGGTELDIVDLALQMEHAGPGFISTPRWRKMASYLKIEGNVERVLGRVFIDAAEKGIFASSRDLIEGIIPAIEGHITAQQAAELGTRPGNLTEFAKLMGGYPLTE